MANLDDLVRDLQALGSIGKEAIEDCAREIEREMHTKLAAQQDPVGRPWPKRSSGSKPLLPGAASHLRVVAIGESVFARTSGADARHSVGAVKGSKKRTVIPFGSLPTGWADAFKRALDKTFTRLTGAK